MKRHAFTLVELLVTIVIIGIMASMVLGAMHAAQNTAREAATKATIAKLNAIIMQRYESYMTRRVPIQIPPGIPPQLAAWMRLDAIRDLMRMEMPERWVDIYQSPVAFPARTLGTFTTGPYSLPQDIALHRLYQSVYVDAANNPKPNEKHSHAKCLYLIVSLGSPEAMEQFSSSEVAVDSDGFQYFVDGWGNPIFFLRWAPGASSNQAGGFSSIQTGDPATDHDPFDSRNVDDDAFRLIPLIFSFGRTGEPNIDMGTTAYYGNSGGTWTTMDPYSMNVGAVADPSAAGNITNHLIEQR